MVATRSSPCMALPCRARALHWGIRSKLPRRNTPSRTTVTRAVGRSWGSGFAARLSSAAPRKRWPVPNALECGWCVLRLTASVEHNRIQAGSFPGVPLRGGALNRKSAHPALAARPLACFPRPAGWSILDRRKRAGRVGEIARRGGNRGSMRIDGRRRGYWVSPVHLSGGRTPPLVPTRAIDNRTAIPPNRKTESVARLAHAFRLHGSEPGARPCAR